MSVFKDLLNKTKKQEPSATQTPPPSGGNTTDTSGNVTKPESQSQSASKQAPTEGASLERALQFIDTIKSRRSIYALGKDQVLSDKDVVE